MDEASRFECAGHCSSLANSGENIWKRKAMQKKKKNGLMSLFLLQNLPILHTGPLIGKWVDLLSSHQWVVVRLRHLQIQKSVLQKLFRLCCFHRFEEDKSESRIKTQTTRCFTLFTKLFFSAHCSWRSVLLDQSQVLIVNNCCEFQPGRWCLLLLFSSDAASLGFLFLSSSGWTRCPTTHPSRPATHALCASRTPTRAPTPSRCRTATCSSTPGTSPSWVCRPRSRSSTTG